MKFFGKPLGLLLASLALASCGGGGGNGGSFSPPQSGTITLNATRTNLPVNVWGYKPTQYGNPTQAEVTITWRNADGTLVTGKDIMVSISPTNIAALSCLVDGKDCTDGNALFGSVPIKGINGQASIFVNATETAGTATFTVSATDPNTGRSVSQSLPFTVVSGVGPTPASVNLAASQSSVYLPSSGGNSSSTITATVRDGSGQLVPDPTSGNNGYDNIKFELVGDTGDAVLGSSSVSGAVSGKSVTSHTVHGVAIASFQAGNSTPPGPVQIRATVDRADNNVTNGITDPVSTTTTIVVSDGKLFSLVLTSPTTNSITVNPVSDNVTGPTDSSGNAIIPPSPDGTYSLTVSALATDRQGNPVPQGTTIEFGIIDAPMQGFPLEGAGTFLIAGNDGDPQEGGKLFTAPNGHFVTAGGGAGPGDTLLVFGKAVPGNSDLESARQIQAVSGETSLSVTYPFNPNDTTGKSVDNGPVLPYAIGRAQEGNIGATAKTDANGVARTTLNYPVSRIGKGALIWARGTGAPVNGTPRVITDISGGGFPGVRPGTLLVDQSPLPGNTVVPVQVCLFDALKAPIQGAHIRFSFVNLGAGTGKIDGRVGAGALERATDGGGCAIGVLQTSGLSGGGTGGGSGTDEPAVIFSAGPGVTNLNVPIKASGGLILQVSPSSLGGHGGTVNLSLTDASGNPVSGTQVGVTCDAGVSTNLIAPTDAGGHSSATITADLDAYKKTNAAKCTFTAAGVTAVVNLQGLDLCTINPNNTQCGGKNVLQAVPSSLGGQGGTVTLLLTDASGAPIPNVQISASCGAGAAIGLISPTGANGRSTATITAGLDGYGSKNVKNATCTFTGALSDAPSATVYLVGQDLCTASSNNPDCGSTKQTLSILILNTMSNPPAGMTVSIGSTPPGVSIVTCVLKSPATTAACSADFNKDQPVALSVNRTPANTGTLTWSGDCAGTSATTTVVMSAAKSCVLTVN